MSVVYYDEAYVRGGVISGYGGEVAWTNFISESLAYPFATNRNATIVQLSALSSFEDSAVLETWYCNGGGAYIIASSMIAGASVQRYV